MNSRLDKIGLTLLVTCALVLLARFAHAFIMESWWRAMWPWY